MARSSRKIKNKTTLEREKQSINPCPNLGLIFGRIAKKIKPKWGEGSPESFPFPLTFGNGWGLFFYLKKSNHLPNQRGFSAIFISVPSLVFHAVVFLMAGVNRNLRCIWVRVNHPQPPPGMASQHQCGVPATWRWAFPTCRKAFGPLPYFPLPHPCTHIHMEKNAQSTGIL